MSKNSMPRTQQDYLRIIALAVINLCDNHGTLLERGQSEEGKKHVERPCHFRIAHYLANMLEDGQHDFFIDSELNRNGNASKRLTESSEHVIPDIVYHNRKSGDDAKNIFVIEIKIGTPEYTVTKKEANGSNTSIHKDDRWKVYGFLKDNILHYTYGFCISEIKQNKFIIHTIGDKDANGRLSTKQYKYKKDSNGWPNDVEGDTISVPPLG